MKDLNPTVLAAFLTATASLVVALISLYGNRTSERKKLIMIIKNQEIQNRVSGLHTAIETLQKMKDLLREFILELENKKNPKIEDVWQSFEDFSKSYFLNYASGLSSLQHEEGNMLHNLKSRVESISYKLHESAAKGFFDIKHIDQLKKGREELSEYQERFRKLRNQIIHKL